MKKPQNTYIAVLMGGNTSDIYNRDKNYTANIHIAKVKLYYSNVSVPLAKNITLTSFRANWNKASNANKYKYHYGKNS